MKTIQFNPKEGFPVGENLFYRCKLCGTVIPSQPNDSAGCMCGNIFIDVDYARFSVKNLNELVLLQNCDD